MNAKNVWKIIFAANVALILWFWAQGNSASFAQGSSGILLALSLVTVSAFLTVAVTRAQTATPTASPSPTVSPTPAGAPATGLGGAAY